MALERDELETLRPKQDKSAVRLSLTGLHQAGLKAEAVTGDAAWDTYCSYLSRAIEVAQQQRADAMSSLASPQMVSEDKIAATRNRIFQLDERIRCLEWAITMPAEIKKAGSLAKEKLKEMDIKDAEGEAHAAA